jgi:hypothetical protein
LSPKIALYKNNRQAQYFYGRSHKNSIEVTIYISVMHRGRSFQLIFSKPNSIEGFRFLPNTQLSTL